MQPDIHFVMQFSTLFGALPIIALPQATPKQQHFPPHLD
jgi:hypothetical protein